MSTLNEQAQFLKDNLDLVLEIQAVKFIEDESQIPENAVRAKDELGHLALCQAMALTKRQGKTVYTCKEAEWCWAPVISLGYVECEPGTPGFEEVSMFIGISDPDRAKAFLDHFPKLPYGKYKGLLIAPARTADFEPDVLLINCDHNFQLRTLIGAIKSQTGKMLDVSLEMIDSCVYTLVKSMITREYTMAVPDPGDQERALAQSNEMILGVPVEKMGELIEGCKFNMSHHIGYHDMQPMMEYEFERPSFYNRLFELWGLGQSKVWERELKNK